MHIVQELQNTPTYNVNKSPLELDQMFTEFENLLNSDFLQRTSGHTKADARNLSTKFSNFIIKNLANIYQCGVEQFFVRSKHNFEVLDLENNSHLKSLITKAINFVAGDFVIELQKLKSYFQKNSIGNDFVICSNLHGSNPILSYQILRGASSEGLIIRYAPIQKDLEFLAFISRLNSLLDHEFSDNTVEFICTKNLTCNASKNYFLAEKLYNFLLEFQNSETAKHLQIKMFEADERDFRFNLYSTFLDDKYEINLLFTKRSFLIETDSVLGKRLHKIDQSEKHLVLNLLIKAIEPDYYQFRFNTNYDFQSQIIEWLKSSALDLYNKEIIRKLQLNVKFEAAKFG